MPLILLLLLKLPANISAARRGVLLRGRPGDAALDPCADAGALRRPGVDGSMIDRGGLVPVL
jgi:hypothetical protein